MARRSLSSQVLLEVDRVGDILRGAKSIVDPMTAHMIETALQGLHAIETLCLSAQQTQVNEVLSTTPLAVAFGDAPPAPAPKRRRAATGTTSRARKSTDS